MKPHSRQWTYCRVYLCVAEAWDLKQGSSRRGEQVRGNSRRDASAVREGGSVRKGASEGPSKHAL